MAQFNIHIAKAHLSELIQRALLGEEVIIAKDNKAVVQLTVIHPLKGKRRLGTAKGLIHISKDFDKPLDDFKEYTE